MDKFGMAKFLLEDAEKESMLLEKYRRAERTAQDTAKRTGKYVFACIEWDGRLPHKSQIVDDCKIARRLLSEIAKEVEQNA